MPHPGGAERGRNPFAAVSVGLDHRDPIALRELGILRRNSGRIEGRLATADNVGDEELALEMPDAGREGVMPAAGGIAEGDVAMLRLVGQLERPVAVDRVLNELLVEQRRQTRPELCIPLRTRRFGIR